MAIHSSTIAWKIPWTEESGRLQCMRSQSQTGPSDFTFTFIVLTQIQLCLSLTVAKEMATAWGAQSYGQTDRRGASQRCAGVQASVTMIDGPLPWTAVVWAVSEDTMEAAHGGFGPEGATRRAVWSGWMWAENMGESTSWKPSERGKRGPGTPERRQLAFCFCTGVGVGSESFSLLMGPHLGTQTAEYNHGTGAV